MGGGSPLGDCVTLCGSVVASGSFAMGITSCMGGASRVDISAIPRVGSGLPCASSSLLWSPALAAAAIMQQQQQTLLQKQRALPQQVLPQKQALLQQALPQRQALPQQHALPKKHAHLQPQALPQQQALPQPRRCRIEGLRSNEKNGLGLPNLFAKDSWQPANRGILQRQLRCRGSLRTTELIRLPKTHLLRLRIVASFVSPGCSKHRNPKISASAMGGNGGIFDLEKQFAQYGAYHSNKINVLIHVIFVWPILLSAFTLLAYTQPLAPQTPFMAALPYHEYMVLNYSFVAAAVYALFYISLERKSGSLAALLVLCCWIAANAAAQHIPYASGWKIVAVSQVVCWSFQFIGHGVFEGRAPALLDNLAQAFLMAPYFVLLEVLHTLFHYEPYSGFNKSVQNKVGVQIAEFRAKKAKAKRME